MLSTSVAQVLKARRIVARFRNQLPSKSEGVGMPTSVQRHERWILGEVPSGQRELLEVRRWVDLEDIAT
jgi:hypothetical protein